MRLYGRRFWPSLALGLSLAVVDQVAVPLSLGRQLLVFSTLGAVLLTGSYVVASALAGDVQRLAPRTVVVALALGVLVFLPVPFLMVAFVLPAVAWLALVGLAVPVAVIERTGPRASLARAVALGRADYVHALGSLATLAIVFFLTRLVLFFLLRDFGEAGARVGLFLADLVISPLLFLGAALLYFDQAARVTRVPGAPLAKEASARREGQYT